MRPLVLGLAAVTAFARGASLTHGSSRQQPNPTGCYHFDRPLGASASGDVERSDSTWYAVQLLPEGRVARPSLTQAYWREQYAARSSWRQHGDSLLLRVSNGLAGWDIAATLNEHGSAGTARYLMDALGGPAVIVPLHARREACPSPHLRDER